MVQRGSYLAEARAVLDDHAKPMRQRLERAGKLFWRAYVFEGSQWPEPARRAAGRLLNELFAFGRISRTLTHVPDGRMTRIFDDLRALVDRCSHF